MQIDLSSKEFRRLLDLVYIGNWVLNSTRGEDRFEDYDNVRQLALHRISRSDVTEFSVERPKGFSLDAYIAERHFNYTDGENQKIRLSFDFTNPVTAQNLRKTPFNRSQKIIEVEKGLWRLTVEIEDSPLLAGWFAVWSDRAGISDIRKEPLEEAAAPQTCAAEAEPAHEGGVD